MVAAAERRNIVAAGGAHIRAVPAWPASNL